jgi:hypothetical protein
LKLNGAVRGRGRQWLTGVIAVEVLEEHCLALPLSLPLWK